MQRVSSPTFKKVMTSARRGEKIVPVLQSYLFDPKFDSFVVKTQGFEQRDPDGWFHPSTHPMWPERLLYYYLGFGAKLVPELFDPMSTLAVTQGQFWHAFIGQCGLDSGLLSAIEVYVEDTNSLSRGHMDGLGDWGVFELKTMNSMKMRKIDTLEDFIERCPDYYAQGQEYMRMSEIREHRTLLIGTEYPFEMKEIVMPFDRAFAIGVRDKYLRVIQAVGDQRPATPCCAPGSKDAKKCPARTICPVAA